MRFEYNSFSDIQAIRNLSTKELQEELLSVNECLNQEKDNRRREDLRTAAEAIQLDLDLRNTDMDKERQKREAQVEAMFLPEYRKNGYFNSPEFRKIEEEADAAVEKALEDVEYEHLVSKPQERGLLFAVLKQAYLKNVHNIDWLPYEERFMPNVQVIVDRF